MAKKTNAPASDPASLAFSAVEDALKDSMFGDPAAADGPAPADQPTRPAVERTERARATEKIAGQTGSVANDDRFQASKILYGLQARSSNAPTWIAALVS